MIWRNCESWHTERDLWAVMDSKGENRLIYQQK